MRSSISRLNFYFKYAISTRSWHGTQVWEKGRGSIQRIRTEGATISGFFRGSKRAMSLCYAMPKNVGVWVDSPKRCPNGGMITDYELVDILSTIFAHSHGFPQVLRVSGCCTGEQGTAAEVSALAWRGSAKDTLAMEAAKCGAIHFGDTRYLPGHKKRPISCSDT